MRQSVVLLMVVLSLGVSTSKGDFIGNPEHPDGYIGLDVGGHLYDVEFRLATFVDIWGDPPATWAGKTNPDFSPPTFWHDPASNLLASNALRDAFNDAVPTPTWAGVEPETQVRIPYNYHWVYGVGVFVQNRSVYRVNSTPPYNWSTATSSSSFKDVEYTYAVFTYPSVVPVPGAVLLGMIGLSIAGVKLRKSESECSK